MFTVCNLMRWISFVQDEMDAQLKELLGEKTADDEKPLQKKKEKKPRGGAKAEVNTLCCFCLGRLNALGFVFSPAWTDCAMTW